MNANQTFEQALRLIDVTDMPVCVVLGTPDREDNGMDFQSLNISREVQGAFSEIIRDFLKKYLRAIGTGELRLLEYLPDYKPEEHEVEYIDLSESGSCIAKPTVPSSIDIPLLDHDSSFLDTIRFYTLVVESPSKNFAFFRKYNKNKELTRSRNLIIQLVGERYDRLKEPTFQFDQDLDVLLYDNYMFLFNKANFTHIFQVYAPLKQVAEQCIDSICDVLPISNSDGLKDCCMGHLQKMQKLHSIASRNYIQRLTIDSLRNTIRKYDLDISIVTENGLEKLVFDRSHAWDFLRLIDDAYLDSSLSGNQYEVNSKRQLNTRTR